MGYIAGIGGANMDVHGQSLAPIVMRDSNPGRLHRVGGRRDAQHVLDNLARLGDEVRPGERGGGRRLRPHAAARPAAERLGVGTRGMLTRPGPPVLQLYLHHGFGRATCWWP